MLRSINSSAVNNKKTIEAINLECGCADDLVYYNDIDCTELG